LRLILALLL